MEGGGDVVNTSSEMAASTRLQVLSGYRRLLRASRALFGEDTYAMQMFQVQAREEYEKDRGVTDPNKIRELMKKTEEAEEFLRTSFVQGRKNERGNYEVKIDGSKVEESDKNRLEPVTKDSADRLSGEVKIDKGTKE